MMRFPNALVDGWVGGVSGHKGRGGGVLSNIHMYRQRDGYFFTVLP